MGSWDQFESIDFHDSTISDLRFSFEESQLRLTIDLCNWRQDTYQPEEPEVVTLTILFTKVHSFGIIGPSDSLLEHEEIFRVKITPTGTLPNLDLVKVEFILNAPHLYADFAVLEVVASNVELLGDDNKPI